MTELLDGTVAAVTGAGRGLGRAYALALAREGAAIVVNDRDKEPADEVVAEIVGAGGRAVASPDSVADPDSAARIVERAVGEFGRIDVMVTNAGADRRGPALDLTLDDFDFTLKTHLYGSICCATAAGRAMVQQGSGGSIIIVTSAAFFAAPMSLAPYCVSKGGTYALMQSLSVELAPVGIRVNAVFPPATRTDPMLAYVDLMAESGAPVDAVEWMKSNMQEPEDVAPLVVYLASAASEGVNGQAFTITRDALTLIEPPTEGPSHSFLGSPSASDVAGAVRELLADRA
jgi:3-oxoacyl-[acyl-carrier protein] reductase